MIQFCRGCKHWQWGPEWICHRCNSFDRDWREVAGKGVIYSYQRVWHPVHPALNGHGPYIAVLVELPAADNVRMIGNLLGDPKQDVPIGGTVEAVFEHHASASPPYSLVHWRLV
ncbi:OB-fold domain-containing protein [Rhodopila globiformis]